MATERRAMPDISIVIPVYRSAPILPELVAQVAAVIADWNCEVILVNDASPDDSWNVIRALALRYPFLKGICLARNFGQHNAIMAGLNQASGDVVVIMDDDLQHPPRTIAQLVDAIRSGHDVCYTRYIGRKHAAWKRLGSWFNDRVASILLKKPKGLYLSSYKAITGTIAQQIVRYDGPYAYVDGLILDATRNITVVPIEHQPRHQGEGNYGLRKSISLWLRMATSFSVVPLRIASFAGLILSVVSAVVMLAVIIDKLRHPETPAGWASLATIVLFMGGMQLLCLGIMGEYLGRAYLKLNHKPQFIVRDRVDGGTSVDDERP
jgi:undecaprenyl-phosphate 4-deoxy-4-formamido-L-arabinose transferase